MRPPVVPSYRQYCTGSRGNFGSFRNTHRTGCSPPLRRPRVIRRHFPGRSGFLEEPSRLRGQCLEAVADYIPELSKADPALSASASPRWTARSCDRRRQQLPFTIQSISRSSSRSRSTDSGPKRVEDGQRRAFGRSFNSIHLTTTTVRSIHGQRRRDCLLRAHPWIAGDGAFEHIRRKNSGHSPVDRWRSTAVYASEAPPAITTAPSPTCCGTIRSLRATSTPFSMSASISARCSSRRATSP